MDITNFDTSALYKSAENVKKTPIPDEKVYDLIDIVDYNDVYKYAGNQIGYVTKYPEYATWRDNEDYYAQQQSFLGKMKAGGIGMLSLAASSFANQFANNKVMFDAAKEGRWTELFDNPAAEGLAQKMTAMSYLNPIYETREQQQMRDLKGDTALENSWLSLKQYVPFSGRAANSYASLGQQLGFTVGTIAYLAAETAALGAATSYMGGAAGWAKVPLNLQKAFKAIGFSKNIGKVEDVAKTALKGYGTVAQGRNLIKQGQMLEKGFNYGISGLQQFRTTIAEGGMEAAMSAMEYKEERLKEYEDKGIDPTEADILDIEESARKIGNLTLNSNIGILSITNALTLGKFFYRGVSKTRVKNPITDLIKPVIKDGSLTTMTTKELAMESGKLGLVKFYGKKALGLAKNSTWEGIEEISQGIASKSAKRYVEQMENPAYDTFMTFGGVAVDELKDSLKSREGWDEFWAGFLTGVPITAAGAAKDRITGETKAQEERLQQAKIDIQRAIDKLPLDQQQKAAEAVNPHTNRNISNGLVNFLTGYQSVEAANKGDVKKAKDFEEEGKAEFFYTMMKYGMLDETVDQMGDLMEEVKESDPETFKAQMGNRTVQEVKDTLKRDGKAYDEFFTSIDKKIGNPYDGVKDKAKYVAYEKAKQLYTNLKFFGYDSTNRANALRQEISEQSDFNQLVLEALIDPQNINDKINQLKADILSAQESEIAYTEAQKEQMNRDLKALEKIQQLSFDKKGNYKLNRSELGIVKEVVKTLYGKSYNIDAELEKKILDIITLEDEAALLRHTVNSLDNEEYFDKFAQSWMGVALKSKSMLQIDPTERTPERQVERKEEEKSRIESLSNKDLEKEIDSTEGGAAANQILENNKDKITFDPANQKYKIGEAEFDTLKEALDSVIESLPEADKAAFSTDTLSEAVKENFKRKNEGIYNKTKATQDNEADLRPPLKTTEDALREANKEKKGFFIGSPSAIVAHFFDYVVSKFWKADTANDILGKWLKLDSEEDVSPYVSQKRTEYDAIIDDTNVGEDYNLVSISLSDPNAILGNRTAEQYNKEAVYTQVIVDENTGRVFIFVKPDVEVGFAVENDLGLKVKVTQRQGFQIVEDIDGVNLLSPYNAEFNKRENKVALNRLKKGDSVELRVANNEYNQTLKADKKSGKISEDEYYANLAIEVRTDGLLIGILRRSDFLFDNPKQQEAIEQFRDVLQIKLNTTSLGGSLGFVMFKQHNTGRGYNIDGNGEAQATSVNEFMDAAKSYGHKVEVFVAEEVNKVVDKNGNDVTSKLDRGNFKKGQAYMRVSSKDGLVHTVAVTLEGGKPLTQENLNEEDILDRLQTVLDPKTPIISKRAILDLSKLYGAEQTNRFEDLDTDIQNEIDANDGEFTFEHNNGSQVTLYDAKVDENGTVSGKVVPNIEAEERTAPPLKTKKQRQQEDDTLDLTEGISNKEYKRRIKLVTEGEASSPLDFILRMIVEGNGLSAKYLKDKLGYTQKDNPALTVLITASRKGMINTAEGWYEAMPEGLQEQMDSIDFENMLLNELAALGSKKSTVNRLYQMTSEYQKALEARTQSEFIEKELDPYDGLTEEEINEIVEEQEAADQEPSDEAYYDLLAQEEKLRLESASYKLSEIERVIPKQATQEEMIGGAAETTQQDSDVEFKPEDFDMVGSGKTNDTGFAGFKLYQGKGQNNRNLTDKELNILDQLVNLYIEQVAKGNMTIPEVIAELTRRGYVLKLPELQQLRDYIASVTNPNVPKIGNNKDSFTDWRQKKVNGESAQETSADLSRQGVFTPTESYTDAEGNPIPVGPEMITSGEEMLEEEVVEEDPNAFPENGTKPEKKKWVETSGQKGVTYQLDDNTSITVTNRQDGATEVVQQTGDVKAAYTIKNGKRTYKKGRSFTQKEMNNPSNKLLLEVYDATKDGTVGFKEKVFLLRHADKINTLVRRRDNRTAKADFNRSKSGMLEGFAFFLQTLGVDAQVVIGLLYDIYRASVEQGNPYNYVDDLLADTPLTDSQRTAIEAYLTPATSILLWAYITQADAVKGLRRNNAFKSFRESEQRQRELQDYIDSLKEADKVTRRAKEYILDRTVKPFVNEDDDDTLQFVYYDALKYLSKEALTNILEKLQALKLNPEKLSNLTDFLKEAAKNNVEVVINSANLFYFTRVAKKSLGRELTVDDKVKLMIEADNINQGLVLNEKDGFYVSVPEEIKIEDENTLKQIWNLQKLFLSLGFEVSEQGLMKYHFINENFDGLQERALTERLFQDNTLFDSNTVIDKEDTTKEGKLVKPNEKIKSATITIDNNVYRKVADGYYISANESMNALELKEYLAKKGIKGKDYLMAQNALTSIKKATNKNKNEITCE